MASLVDDILKVVADVSGVAVGDILGESRVSDIVDARHIAIYYCVKNGVGSGVVSKRFGKSRYSVNRVVSTYYSRRTEQFYLWNEEVHSKLCEITNMAHK